MFSIKNAVILSAAVIFSGASLFISFQTSAQQVPQVLEAYVRSGLVPRVVHNRHDEPDSTVVVGAMFESPRPG